MWAAVTNCTYRHWPALRCVSLRLQFVCHVCSLRKGGRRHTHATWLIFHPSRKTALRTGRATWGFPRAVRWTWGREACACLCACYEQVGARFEGDEMKNNWGGENISTGGTEVESGKKRMRMEWVECFRGSRNAAFQWHKSDTSWHKHRQGITMITSPCEWKYQ